MTNLAVLLLLLGAIGASAQSGDPMAGADVFASDCARCHKTAERILRKIEGDTNEEKSAWLDGFLDDHYLSGPEDKADLISYLTGL